MRLALVVLANLVLANTAFAAEKAMVGGINDASLAVLAVAIAVFGGAFGQSRVASSTLDAISRNPGASGSLQTPFIIGMALIESLVILALVAYFTMG